MKNTEIFYFDVDGTLVDLSTGIISKETINSLNKLHDNGYLVALCTGRTLAGLEAPPVKSEFDWDGYVLGNGGKVLDRDLNEIYELACEPEFIDDLIELYPGSLLMEGDVNTITSDPDEDLLRVASFFNIDMPEARYDGHPVHKILVANIDLIPDGKDNPIFANYDMHQNTSGSYDVFPKNSGKHIGIKHLNKHLHVTKSTGFGDGTNDVEFLQQVTIGIAMGNSVEELKEIADYVTTDVSEEGITYALKKFEVID